MTEYSDFKDAAEASAFKDKVVEDIHALLLESMKHIKPELRWLIRGRVLNALFSHHYAMSYFSAEESLAKRQKELDHLGSKPQSSEP